MSPKEQANWLINKFYNLHAWEVMELDKRKTEYDIAKQAAIICVEQIIEVLDTAAVIGYFELRAYWENVIEHIKNS